MVKIKPLIPAIGTKGFRVATQIILPLKYKQESISQKYYKGYYPFGSSPTVRQILKLQYLTGKWTDLLSFPAFTKRRLSAKASEILFFLNTLTYTILCYYITLSPFFQFFFYTVSKLSMFFAISTAFFSSSPRAIKASPLIISLI